jgi:hypothetical protein
MKKQFLFLLLVVSGFGFAQSINEYKAVIVPLKFDFLKTENQYRLATLSKFNLTKAGFEVYYSNQILPKDISDRCAVLNYNVVKENAFLITKLYITFKDCYGKIVFQSELGTSREKEFQLAYTEALNNAFTSVYELNYHYNEKGKSEMKVDSVPVAKVTVPDVVEPVSVPVKQNEVLENVIINSDEVLYAQPIGGGFQLIDSKPSVVMKIFKTSDENSFLATKGSQQGVLINKGNQWFFEYYQNDKLVSEKINVKF